MKITPTDCTPQEIAFAQTLYERYCENSDNQNYQGNPCPTWTELPLAIQGHWCACARLALNASLSLTAMATREAWCAALGHEDAPPFPDSDIANYLAWFRRRYGDEGVPKEAS